MGAVDLGQPDLAALLARQTVIGSAALAESSPDTSAAALRENVTSPGGTRPMIGLIALAARAITREYSSYASASLGEWR